MAGPWRRASRRSAGCPGSGAGPRRATSRGRTFGLGPDDARAAARVDARRARSHRGHVRRKPRRHVAARGPRDSAGPEGRAGQLSRRGRGTLPCPRRCARARRRRAARREACARGRCTRRRRREPRMAHGNVGRGRWRRALTGSRRSPFRGQPTRCRVVGGSAAASDAVAAQRASRAPRREERRAAGRAAGLGAKAGRSNAHLGRRHRRGSGAHDCGAVGGAIVDPRAVPPQGRASARHGSLRRSGERAEAGRISA